MVYDGVQHYTYAYARLREMYSPMLWVVWKARVACAFSVALHPVVHESFWLLM